jgi:hypothetical protein
MTSNSKRKLALRRVVAYEAARRRAWDAELAAIGEFDISGIDGMFKPGSIVYVDEMSPIFCRAGEKPVVYS